MLVDESVTISVKIKVLVDESVSVMIKVLVDKSVTVTVIV